MFIFLFLVGRFEIEGYKFKRYIRKNIFDIELVLNFLEIKKDNRNNRRIWILELNINDKKKKDICGFCVMIVWSKFFNYL